MPSLSALVIRLPKASLCEPAGVFCDGVSSPANPAFGTPKELTLAIESPLGLVLVGGCSHPGVEEILNAASAGTSHVLMLAWRSPFGENSRPRDRASRQCAV